MFGFLSKEGIMTTIIVSVKPEETRMGIVVNNRMCEYVVERDSEQHLVSSVFKGKINNVVPGIQAAFIDIGKEQNAFLYMEKGEKLTEGQAVLVQVMKDARGTKGPAVTREITLPGRYLVLQPFRDTIAISKKITGKSERRRLRDFVEAHKPLGMGFVIRTAAEGINEENLLADIKVLLGDWQVISARGKRAKAPSLLYRELDLSVRIVRDYVTEDVNKIIIDDKTVCQRVEELLINMDNINIETVFYEEKIDVFTKFKLNKQIEAISDRQIWLECGGYLVIDYTEAMTVIDVNSGKYSGQESLEATIMEINRQAALEIARQLRLRDIGGIVVVDFIDMHTAKHQEEILHILRKALTDDKMDPKVQDITKLNLVEITRRKARQNLSTVLYSDCPVCQGSGRVQSPETVGVEIRRRLRSFMQEGNSSKNLLVSVHPLVAKWLLSNSVKAMEKEFFCSIKVESDASLHVEAFAILADDQ